MRKWLRRWEPGSLRGLADRSRAPLYPRRGVTAAERRRAASLKRKLPSWGAARMKRDFGLALSEKALRRIWREEGLLRRKRRKHKTKQCLREVKRRWRLFEQTSVDTKDLCDIPELWVQAQASRVPRYQYTAREVVSGWHYVAFAQECTLAYAKLFAEVVTAHLNSCGVKFRGSRLLILGSVKRSTQLYLSEMPQTQVLNNSNFEPSTQLYFTTQQKLQPRINNLQPI